MSIKTFWVILLKIIGLLFLFQLLTSIISSISSVYIFFGFGTEELITAIVGLIFILFFFYLITRTFLIKPNWLIDKLKLTEGFEEETIDLSLSNSSILKLAVIIIGGIMFVHSVPEFFRDLILSIQDATYPQVMELNLNSTWTFLYLLKTITGYLMMTNSDKIVAYFERK